MPEEWLQSTVITPIHCRRCGYDLRGLRADGRCPECGMEIWQSVLHTVDPDASRLPRLRNPPAVGDAVFVLMACMFIGTLLLVIRPLAVEIDSWDPRGALRLRHYIPRSLSWGSAVILLAGLWAIWKLAPPRGKEPSGAIWVDIWLIAVGFVGSMISAALLGDAIDRQFSAVRILVLHVSAAVTAVVGLVGLRGVLGVIGRRSREYRRSKGGRQGVEAMIAAIAGGLIGAAIRHLAVARYLPRDWALGIGSVILWISTLMLLIGLAYMVMNAWWIRQALRKPPPPVDQVLLPSLPDDTWIPDREE